MADDAAERLSTLAELQRRVPSIVKRVNADPSLALRAGANPLLALAEMGYKLTPELEREVALRIRFNKEQISRLDALSANIHKLAGTEFDIDSPDELSRVLFEKLKLPTLPPPAQRVVIAQKAVAPRLASRPVEALHPLDPPYRVPGGVAHADVLEVLKGAHPVIEPLLEYRAIQASVPPLASKELYDRVARGDVKGPKLRLRASLKRGPTPE
jgi:hypothetical protein